MSAEPRRLAVIGCGQIGRSHIARIRRTSGAVLAAISDSDPSAGDLADEIGVPYFAGRKALLSEVPLDGAVIATPNPTHAELGLACIKARVPALIEKPVSDRVEDAIVLADRSEAAGVPILVGHHRRHSPFIRKAREMVRSGALGSVVAISAVWLVKKPDAYFEADWRRGAGGGPILINLIHDIDCLRAIAGDIASVQAEISSARRGFEVEDSAAVILRMASGALATAVLSDAAPSPWSWELTAGEQTSYPFPMTGQDAYRFVGTKAALEVPTLRVWRHSGAGDWLSPMASENIPVERVDPLEAQLAHFIDVIAGRAKPLIDARDAAETLRATLAVKQAALTGQRVDLL